MTTRKIKTEGRRLALQRARKGLVKGKGIE